MLVLGIGGWLRDGAAAVLRDGKIVAAIEEEKLSRRPHPAGLPRLAVDACLGIAGAGRSDVDIVALARPIDSRREPAFLLRLKTQFPKARVIIVDHHEAHAASAFYPSPFEKARVLTVDRRGDMRCGVAWEADGVALDPIQDFYSPDTPAAIYSRTAELIGFRADAEEHKLQWMSVSGEPRYQELFERILGLGSERGINIDHSYLDPSRSTDGGFSEKFYTDAELDRDGELSEANRANLATSVHRAVERGDGGHGG